MWPDEYVWRHLINDLLQTTWWWTCANEYSCVPECTQELFNVDFKKLLLHKLYIAQNSKATPFLKLSALLPLSHSLQCLPIHDWIIRKASENLYDRLHPGVDKYYPRIHSSSWDQLSVYITTIQVCGWHFIFISCREQFFTTQEESLKKFFKIQTMIKTNL